jgi:hypothetical protein
LHAEFTQLFRSRRRLTSAYDGDGTWTIAQ